VTADVIYFSVRRLRYMLSNDQLKARRTGPLLKKFRIAADFIQSCLNAGLHDAPLLNMIVKDMKYAYFDPRPLLEGLNRLSNPPSLPDDYGNVCKQDFRFVRKLTYRKDRMDRYSDNVKFYEKELQNALDGKVQEGADPNEQVEGLKGLIEREKMKLNSATRRYEAMVGYGQRRLKSRTRKFQEFKQFLQTVPLVKPENYEFLDYSFERSYELADWWNNYILHKVDIEIEGVETDEIMKLRRKRVDKELRMNREPKFWNQVVTPPSREEADIFLPSDYDTDMSEVEELLGSLNKGDMLQYPESEDFSGVEEEQSERDEYYDRRYSDGDEELDEDSSDEF
jgi:hypothetical protein